MLFVQCSVERTTRKVAALLLLGNFLASGPSFSSSVNAFTSSPYLPYCSTITTTTCTHPKRASLVQLQQQQQSEQHQQNEWQDFDYNQHWYPVTWLCDLVPNQPTKVTLFDVDYVVAVTDNKNHQQITALRDACPHKAAALSEGRLTASGHLQCAYHGWSFNGTTGACQQIPQAAASSTTTTFSSRTCAQAIPATVHQGLLWLWPGPPPLQHYPTPPSIPEMDHPDFRVLSKSVRDFPVVDWTLLVSNILDPDHGLFARALFVFVYYCVYLV